MLIIIQNTCKCVIFSVHLAVSVSSHPYQYRVTIVCQMTFLGLTSINHLIVMIRVSISCHEKLPRTLSSIIKRMQKLFFGISLHMCFILNKILTHKNAVVLYISFPISFPANIRTTPLSTLAITMISEYLWASYFSACVHVLQAVTLAM